MRKIKLEVKLRVPSWNFCTLDGFTHDDRFSKELCRFCIKTKNGYRCMLHDEGLKADSTFVYKCPKCIDVTAGFRLEDEPEVVPVDPKTIIRETLAEYRKAVAQLVAQGFPQSMAETLATKYMLNER